jgi:Xaa-Pro aminopeptidase
MADQGIERMLVTDETNVGYLSGFSGDSSYLLVTAAQQMILSDRRYETQIATECAGWEALVRGPQRTMLQLIKEALAATGGARGGAVALEAEQICWATQRSFAEAMPEFTWIPTRGLVESLRAIKEPREIETLRRAVWVAERSFESLTARLRPQWTELEMAHELEATMRHLGASGCGFDPIVAVGPHAALPHATPRARSISESPVLLIDWGAKFDGYTSDLTRTLHVGPPKGRFAEVYPVVLAAQEAAIAAIRPGVELRGVDAAARQVITDAGWGDYFGHGLGHGIGLQVHESPRLSAISEGTLEAGMVVTVEPGIYLPGELGVRLEDDVLVTESGHEVLSSLPKGLEACSVML